MAKDDISVIIVNYNGGEQILACLKSLKTQTYKNHRVIVVDNDSGDGSVSQIKKQFPQVRLIENNYNAGWGVACNIGILADDSEFIVLLNNDAYLDQNCLKELVNGICMQPEYGACASKILLWDDPKTIEVVGVVTARDGLSVGRGRLEPSDRYNEIEEVFCANDCCCLYRRSMINDIGLYDPDFFIYADETDMAWRHQLAGWRCIYNPRALAYHAHSGAAGSYSDFKAYHVERNRIYLCLKYFPFKHLVASFFIATFRYIYQVVLARRGQGALARYQEKASLGQGLKVLIRAHWDALCMTPKMLARRRSYHPIKRLSNKEIDLLIKKYAVSIKKVAGYE